jgi:hypothetical protein
MNINNRIAIASLTFSLFPIVLIIFELKVGANESFVANITALIILYLMLYFLFFSFLRSIYNFIFDKTISDAQSFFLNIDQNRD